MDVGVGNHFNERKDIYLNNIKGNDATTGARMATAEARPRTAKRTEARQGGSQETQEGNGNNPVDDDRFGLLQLPAIDSSQGVQVALALLGW